MHDVDPRTIALGIEIRNAAEHQGMPLDRLAKNAGISRATLYNWINGKNAMPLVGLGTIADVLRIPPYELLQRAEERARRSPDEV